MAPIRWVVYLQVELKRPVVELSPPVLQWGEEHETTQAMMTAKTATH